jgi:hypothetical protein
LTDHALTTGLGLLLVLWPHRADSSETVAALRLVYREALGDLTDAAWLGACAAAMRQHRHFPMPVELRELAEGVADSTYRDRVATVERQRIDTATRDGHRLLTAGTINEEQAAANRDRYNRLAADTLRAIRDGGQRAQTEGRRLWLHERQANRNRRIADGHWDTQSDATGG